MMADRSEDSGARPLAADSSLSRRVSRDAQAHTPEPWTTDSAPHRAWICQIGNNRKDPSIWTERQASDGEAYVFGDKGADARRIVACVNACQGIPTDRLENGALAELFDAAHSWQHTPSDSPSAPEVDERLCHAIDVALAKLRGEG